VEDREIFRLLAAPVLRRRINFAGQPLCARVAQQTRDASNIALRPVLPAMKTPDLAHDVCRGYSSSTFAQEAAG